MRSPTKHIEQKRSAARIRLFCFPYAGGGAAIYRKWQAALGPTVVVEAVELPGHGARLRESHIASMPALVERLILEFANQFQQPYAFFGHSLGGLLAFELARACRDRGIPMPQCLFASGCNGPQHPRDEPKIHALPRAELIAKLATYGGTPPEVLADDDLMSLLLPSIRADFALVENYEYTSSRRLPIPIHLLTGRDDFHVQVAGAARWDDETTVGCSTARFDGGHFFITSEQAAVVRHVRARLAPLMVESVI